jgi:hypothetical protein
MQFLAWFQGGQLENVPLVSTRFLQIMSELTVGWLLLDGAAIALEKQKAIAKDHPDWSFYEGKKHAAVYWAHNVLAGVASIAEILKVADRSPLEIPDAAFATV